MAYRQMDTKAPSYLEDFLDQIDMLPTQIKGKFAEMRDMDDRSKNLMNDAEKLSTELVRKANVRGTSNEGLKKSYQEVISLQGKALASAETKLETAETAFSEVDQVIRNLDDKLRDFETQLRKEGRWPASTADKPPRPSAANSAAAAGPGASARGTSGTATTQPKSRRGNAGATARGSAAAAGAPAGTGRAQKATQKEPEMQVSVVEDMVVDPNEPTYCYCNQISFGEMVMCDDDDCPHQWFHFTCVGLTEGPKGSWQCPECKKREKDRRKSDG